MILVSGGTGSLGSRLCRGLIATGNQVRVLTLPGDPGVAKLKDLGDRCEVRYGDVTRPASLAGLFDGVHTVYHLAAVIIAQDAEVFERVNVGGVRNMVNGASQAGVGHFVLVSSAAAYHPEGSAYAASKLRGEEVVRAATQLRHTIIRPTLIYDAAGGQEYRMFVDYLKRFPIVPFVGRGKSWKNPVYAEDIVRGLIAVANNPKAYGKTYDFCGGERIRMWDFAKLALDKENHKKSFVPIPIPLCRLIAFGMESLMNTPPLTSYAISRIEENADYDISAAREDLGYRPVGVREGIWKC